METKHTPTPWEIGKTNSNLIIGNLVVIARTMDHETEIGTRIDDRSEKDAKFIVEVVNAHAALVARVGELEKWVKNHYRPWLDIDHGCRECHNGDHVIEGFKCVPQSQQERNPQRSDHDQQRKG